MCPDTGSPVHAINRLEVPVCEIVWSPGSRVGQQFQVAGGSLVDNEGHALPTLVPPYADAKNLVAVNMQVAEVTTATISVPELAEGNKLQVVCKEKEALVQTPRGQLVVRPEKKGDYICASCAQTILRERLLQGRLDLANSKFKTR